MLNEYQLEMLPERIYERLNQINSDTLVVIGEKIKEIGQIRPSDVHRIQQLRNYGSDMDKITNQLAKASSKNIQDIYDIFDIVAKENYTYAKPFYSAKGLKYIPYDENERLKLYVKSLARQTAEEYVNLTQHTAFSVFASDGKSIAPLFEANKNKIATSLSETYTKVMDIAVTKAQIGLSDYQSAMREVLRAVSSSGIKTVDYATGYTRRLDSAVRQNVLWGLKQCNQNVANEIGKEFGADGMEISMHSNPRPTHVDFQGEQFSLDGDKVIDGKKYEDFYKNAADLLQDYGCLHFSFPILLGISEPTYSKREIDKQKHLDREEIYFEGEKLTRYQATQLQRQAETAIRNAKDTANMAKAAGDDKLRREEQSKINQLTQKYKKISNTFNIPSKLERASLARFRPVKANT